jgi:hypothetical protein
MTHLVPLGGQSDLWLEQGLVKSVDIETGFDDNDFISLSFPAYPLATIDEANSTVDFTSHPSGNFAIGPTDSVSFTATEVPLVAGDSELRFKRGLLSTIDKSKVTGVRFTIEASGAATFRCTSIRCLHKNWVYAPVDLDTLSGELVNPVTRNGSATRTYDASLNPFPRVWRSDIPPGDSDPTPINASLVLRFNPGALGGTNIISTFLRERALDYMTMLDLNGTPLAELNGNPMPDYGEAKYVARTMFDLDAIADSQPGLNVDTGAVFGAGLTMADLDGLPMFDLERKPDALKAAWIELRLTLEDPTSTLEVFDAESVTPYYSFDFNALRDIDYSMFIDLWENTLQVRIFETFGNEIDDLKFDSTKITDPEIFKRRKGRIGWQASLEDGNTVVHSLEPRGLSFAEYRSHPFESLTPVVGAQLVTSSSADTDLFKGIDPGPWGGQFEGYPDRGPEAFVIRNTANLPLQGIQSNSIYFDDFANTRISFDLLVTQAALDVGNILVFLWDGVFPIVLPISPLVGDAFNSIEVDLAPFAPTLLPGNYSLVIVQSLTGLPNDWIVDKLSVLRRNIAWSARNYADNPWFEDDTDWVPANETLNQPSGGVLFHERTNRFQIRGEALRQNSYIDQVRAIPKYAELGRIVWEDEAPVYSDGPTANFSTSISTRTVTFTFTGAGGPGRIIAYEWTFGDGTISYVHNPVHTYGGAGTYPVTITATNSKGQRATHTANVTVA